MSITSKDDLLKKQIEAQEEINSYTCRILVCSGTGCVAFGFRYGAVTRSGRAFQLISPAYS